MEVLTHFIDLPLATVLLAFVLVSGILSASIFGARIINLLLTLPIVIVAGWLMGMWVIVVPEAKHYGDPESIAFETRLLTTWLTAVAFVYAAAFAIQPRLFDSQTR